MSSAGRLREAARSAAADALEEASELVGQAIEALREAGVKCSSLTEAARDVSLKLHASRSPRHYYLGKYLIGVYEAGGGAPAGVFDNVEDLALWLDLPARTVRKAVSEGSDGRYSYFKVPV